MVEPHRLPDDEGPSDPPTPSADGRSELVVVGDAAVDVLVRVEEPIRFGGDARSRVERTPGGSAATTARISAALGRPTRLVTAIGHDLDSRWLLEQLDEVDVRAHVCDAPADTIVVLVDQQGERTMFPDRRCGPQLGAMTEDDLTGVGWLHAPAYGLLDGDALTTTCERARRLGIPFSIDLSSTQVIETMGWRLVEWCRELRPSIVFANGAEAALFGLGSDMPVEGADATIVKRGPLGAEWRRPGASTVSVAVPHTLPLSINTTGAGDAFAAGLLDAVDRSTTPTDALLAGHRAAADYLAARLPAEEPA